MADRIAVIGAGPKGASIAAKAASMSNAGLVDVPEITIFDPDGPGAAWSGGYGYTDGEQPLCTLAERDLGFPYDRFDLGGSEAAGIAVGMLANFSWQAFCVVQGEADTRYDRWVLKGRKPPAHGDFAEYLKFAILRSGANVVHERVVKIDYTSGKWKLHSTPDDGVTTHESDFQGVVVTGSGAATRAFPGAAGCPCVFDARNFWSRTHQVEALLQQAGNPEVVIVGAGGAGAAVANWFVRNRYAYPITIVGREPTLYTRQSGYFEERLFTDQDAWNALPDHSKDAFLRHTTAGVVWDSVLRDITRENISYKCCDAVDIAPRMSMVAGMPMDYCLVYRETPDQLRDTIDAEMLKAGCTPPTRQVLPLNRINATVIVDARGFERLSFVRDMGLEGNLASQFAPNGARWVEEHIDESLALDLPGFPKGLHLPTFGNRRGPGATNLMALGWVANQILSAY